LIAQRLNLGRIIQPHLPLTPGSRLGVYEITAPLGEGGMGQVWRATDTTLGRQVAIKILPDAFAADPDRLARFEREAKTLASLNHPHIAAIHGFEKSSGVQALVMELVEGEDLSQRIARLRAPGASARQAGMPLDEVLPIAKQIAEALEAAHEQGIIHRDLKPANIKVRADGTVKVLDFGLAKAVDPPAASGVTAMNSPTLSVHATQAGIILGTAAYMSPEQARGKAVDKRADIWAFGAVLYEMLTGTRAFPGEDMTDTLAAVVRAEPDWSIIPRDVSPTLLAFLKRCLQKDPKQRVGDIHDVRLALEGAFDTGTSLSTPTTTASSRGRLPWLAALAVAAAVIAAMAMPTLRYLRQTPPPEMRLEILTPASDAPLQFALSPDGRHIVYVASDDGPSRLWLRRLDQIEAKPLAGTEGAINPFWSPDSRSIGFSTRTTLSRLDIAGGVPQFLANLVGTITGGSWNVDGTILFMREVGGPLMRIAAAGGEPVAVTQVEAPRQTGHRLPQFLPDGRHFLFYGLGTPEAAGIYLGSLDGGTPARLTAADSAGAFLPPDRVVFVQGGSLVARRLDPAGRTLAGETITLAGQVGVDTSPRGGFAVSGAGLVAYRAGGSPARQLTWVDRTGKAVGGAGESDPSNLNHPELSPDGRRVAMARLVQGNTDIWLWDLLRGGFTRLTFDAAGDHYPVWSPDGMRIAFSSTRSGVYDLYLKPSNGSGAEERLVASPNGKAPQDWSRDGRWLLYYETNPTTGRDLWALDMSATDRPSTSSGRPEPVEGRPPRGVANTPAEEVLAQFSPDGQWVAYQTNESGRFEVVVQPFPEAGAKWQVSTAGGVAPRWRADGKEIYFLAPDATMMAVPVTAAGPSFEAGTPVALFPTRIFEGGTVALNRAQYTVARDGRFLINQPVGDGAVAPITLILNWRAPATK
jgi:serine/threonine protein kinase/Tol biopolymer transport system component